MFSLRSGALLAAKGPRLGREKPDMFFCYFSSVLAFSFTGSVLPAVWRLHIAVVVMLPYELFTCCAILRNGLRRLLIPRKFMLVVMLNVLCSCFMFTSVSEQPFANNGW